jgi:hypothetical protein
MAVNAVAAYSDGGTVGRNPSPRGGVWAWCHVGSDGSVVKTDSGVLLPGVGLPHVTSNVSELAAALFCLEALPPGWAGTLYLDSDVTLGRLRARERASLRGVHPPLRLAFARVLEGVGSRFNLVLLQGHPTRAELAKGVGRSGRPVSTYNVWCDEMCREAGSGLGGA